MCFRCVLLYGKSPGIRKRRICYITKTEFIRENPTHLRDTERMDSCFINFCHATQLTECIIYFFLFNTLNYTDITFLCFSDFFRIFFIIYFIFPTKSWHWFLVFANPSPSSSSEKDYKNREKEYKKLKFWK